MSMSRRSALLISAAFGTSIFGNTQALQPGSTTFTSELTGVVVDIGSTGDAAFDPDSYSLNETETRSEETILIRRGNVKFYITFVLGDFTPASWEREQLSHAAPGYSKFESLTADNNEKSGWAMYRANHLLQFQEIILSEFELNVFGDFHLALMAMAGPEMMVDQLTWAANNLSVGDIPATLQQDYSHIVPYLEGTSDEEPRLVTEYLSKPEDWVDVGLKSEHAWTSPNHGDQIVWDERWTFAYGLDNAITVDDEVGQDRIRLITPKMDGDAGIYLARPVAEAASPGDWLKRWTSESFLMEQAPRIILDVVGTAETEESAVVIFEATARYGETAIFVYCATVIDADTLLLAVTRAIPEMAGSIYEQFISGISLNGDPMPFTLSVQDLEGMLER